ncbi:MAG: L-histidine N(alpha)-methyltransferase [Actinomycetota bacterium]|nr:L-histidine N(alpha)-methyltransferase [Actinomycetota bacterium]
MPLATEAISIEVHLRPGEGASALLHDAPVGLTRSPNELSPTWPYDEHGRELFQGAAATPEYDPARTERSVLAERAGALSLSVR